MERKIYKFTEKQERDNARLHFAPMPSDDEFRQMWAKKHHGKTAGWGLGKRDWILSNMTGCVEYQLGLWQARLDRFFGLDYQGESITDDNTNAYNLGYYRGWEHGLDQNMVNRFTAEYGNEA